jgi:hypothetical protein
VKRYVPLAFAFCVVMLQMSGTYAQTTTNPDISFIADTRLTDHWNASSDIAANKPQFDFHELELAAGQYLNPYARADAIISLSGSGEVEIEEAYATLLRGLPWSLQVRAGKYFLDFGKINTQHPHQWSWIERPLVNSRFLGADGLKAVGINVTKLIPVGSNALTVSANLIQGNFLLPAAEQNVAAPLAGSGRISFFAQLTEHSEIDMGFSGLYAEHDYANKRWATLGNLDFKYKWKPNIYRSLVIVAEGLLNSRKVGTDSLITSLTNKVTSGGDFAAIDYQFHRRYDVGGLVEYAQSPIDKNDHRTGFGVFGGFALAEETYRVGFLFRSDHGTTLPKSYQTAEIQLLWSLGPHKPHQF